MKNKKDAGKIIIADEDSEDLSAESEKGADSSTLSTKKKKDAKKAKEKK